MSGSEPIEIFIDFTSQSKSAAVAEFRRACDRPEVGIVIVIHKTRKGIELPLVNTFQRKSTEQQGNNFCSTYRRTTQ